MYEFIAYKGSLEYARSIYNDERTIKGFWLMIVFIKNNMGSFILIDNH